MNRTEKKIRTRMGRTKSSTLPSPISDSFVSSLITITEPSLADSPLIAFSSYVVMPPTSIPLKVVNRMRRKHRTG